MKSLTLTLAAALSLTLITTACKKKEADGGGATAAKTADKAVDKVAAAAAKLEWKKLGALGVEAELPADATVDDNTANAGFPAATIWATPTTFVTGGGEMSPMKADLDGAKAEIQKDPNPFKAFTKEDKTDAGWHLEYELESMGDKAKIYGVSIRATIDGKPFDCGSNTRDAAERDNVIRICKSLRKAG